MLEVKKVLFLTGTRADFGKLKSLMLELQTSSSFDIHVFVTGMHMLSKYGYTCEEVERIGIKSLYRYINQNSSDGMDQILAKTILGLSDYVREIRPDLIVVHGDRVEALAGATVGSLNNILTAHIEGGEVSGTIDELIRHAITKLSHVHFVANNTAFHRLMQLGEREGAIHIIGSPEVDVINSSSLPILSEVLKHYHIPFDSYALVAFHPVTTELPCLREHAKIFVDALIATGRNYVVIYPNNDHGSDLILNEYARILNNPRFKIFPSMRFEYFLSLLKNSDFIIGNSSAGVREAPNFGIPSVNIGSRQHNRAQSKLIVNCEVSLDSILNGIMFSLDVDRTPEVIFGEGGSAVKFKKVLSDKNLWDQTKQKYFVDQG